MQNSVLRSRMTLVYCSQPSSVILCIQNSDFSIRYNSLYGSQPSSVFFFVFTTATFGSELKVSMGPTPHLSFCACKTARLAAELQVSVGPYPHLYFLFVKQRLLDQNYKSLWVPDLSCRFVHAKQLD